MIKVVRYHDPIPQGVYAIDTTSRSTNWTRGLSPFFLGPIPLYDGHVSKKRRKCLVNIFMRNLLY
jgi:hypothetical protein